MLGTFNQLQGWPTPEIFVPGTSSPAPGDFIALENSGVMLLESGGKIELE